MGPERFIYNCTIVGKTNVRFVSLYVSVKQCASNIVCGKSSWLVSSLFVLAVCVTSPPVTSMSDRTQFKSPPKIMFFSPPERMYQSITQIIIESGLV